jgi:hypothetical protein
VVRGSSDARSSVTVVLPYDSIVLYPTVRTVPGARAAVADEKDSIFAEPAANDMLRRFYAGSFISSYGS